MRTIIVGAGPVGLLLATELTLAGADCEVWEGDAPPGRPERNLGLRSLNARSMQALALRGLDTEMIRAQWDLFDSLDSDEDDLVGLLLRQLRRSDTRAMGHFAGIPVSGDTDTGVPTVVLKQRMIEEILAARAVRAGVPIHRGSPVVDVTDTGDRVRATFASGETVTADYLVGCDGGRSVVRKTAGFGFTGTDATMTGRVAVAEVDDELRVESRLRGPGGLVNRSLVPGEIATIEFDGGPRVHRDEPMTARELRDSIRRAGGVDIEVTRFETGIRYSDNTRQADSYRKGRVLLAGDAAHVHSPIGGQGLNLGVQDAVNLGWKLALVLRGRAPESLLDTYTAERHPVAARVLRNTRAQVALMRPGPQVDALREVLAEVMNLAQPRRYFAEMVSGTGTRYDPGTVDEGREADSDPRRDAGGDPTRSMDVDADPDSANPVPVGAFLPADRLRTPAVMDVLRHGHGVLIAGADTAAAERALAGYRDRVRPVTDPGAETMLVRPDGYIAWAAKTLDDPGLPGALTAWFGRPS